jgi:hypothetical protein
VSTAYHLSPMVFDFIWEELGLGEQPYPLRVHSHGHTMDERVALRHQMQAEFAATGIKDDWGRIDPRLADWLGLLARAPLSVDALHIPEFETPTAGAIAATDGKDAVLAVQESGVVRLSSIYPDALASSVVDLLPPAQRGTEQSVTMPLDDALRTAPIRVAAGQGVRRDRVPLSERVSADPRQAYAQLSGEPRLRGGQIAVNSRNAVGSRQRSGVLAWFDTASGRYLSLSRPGQDGRLWVTVSPADAKTLRGRLAEMVGEMGQGR